MPQMRGQRSQLCWGYPPDNIRIIRDSSNSLFEGESEQG